MYNVNAEQFEQDWWFEDESIFCFASFYELVLILFSLVMLQKRCTYEKYGRIVYS